jgi:hypothetical protein
VTTPQDKLLIMRLLAEASTRLARIKRRVSQDLLASDTSIETALQPVQVFECIGKGGCDVGSRFAVQPLCLDWPSTSGRIL